MEHRLARFAAVSALVLSCLVFATPALALDSTTRWMGLYVPGAPGNMSPVSSAESQLGQHADVVNFFVADTDPFPSSGCNNVFAHGSTPLITLEFWSTQSGGLASINNGSKDAYLHTFARAAKAMGSTILLRPFHEMNGNWYPWGTTGGNTPAQLVAAYRHVHNIFAQEGATNVKFVWCPNVDFAVAPFYPGDAYVDYAAMDGYNNGQPWRSFGSIFGPTYSAISSVSSRPIFVAETSCVESGGCKAAWIADMFRQISSTYTQIVGVCWFDANKAYDWRVGTSTACLTALQTGFASTAFATVTPAHTSLAIKSNVKSVKRRHAVTLSGRLTPGRASDRVQVVVTVPKHGASRRTLGASSLGSWSMRYTPTVRGTYLVRVTFAGDAHRYAASSKTIRIVVK